MGFSHYGQDMNSEEHQEELGHRSSVILWVIAGIVLIIIFA